MASEKEKVNPIIIEDTDEHVSYTLEFNRDVVRQAEREGFEIMKLPDQPLMMWDLWYYAFRMHHKRVTRSVANKLLEKIVEENGSIPTKLSEVLTKLYMQPIEYLYGGDDDDDGEPKNVNVVVKF